MENDLDIKLYNEYLNGEKSAFEILYKKYKDKICYFVFNIVKDYEKAEDITQEVFMYVLQGKFKSEYSFKTYLYLIAKGRAVNYINSVNKRNEIDDKFIVNENEIIEQDILELITREETKKELIDMINQLDEKYRNALYLVKIEEFSYEETAQILGLSVTNVNNLIHRGKKELRTLLIKKGFREMNKVFKVILVIAMLGIVTTGVVKAKEIEKIIRGFFGLNSSYGVDTAVENGYVEDVSVENQRYGDLNIGIESMLLDEYNFDMKFNVECEEKIDVNNFIRINLPDLKIVNENNEIVFDSHELCEDMSDNHYKGAYSFLPENMKENSFIISLSATGTNFPKSKKLIIDFSKVVDKNNNSFIGNWHFEIDVPEKFYKSNLIGYKAVKCNDKGIDLNKVEASLSNTALKISIPEIKSNKIDYEALKSYDGISIYHMIAIQKEFVVNAKGKKFEASQRSDGDGGYSVDHSEKRITNYYQTFNLTQFDQTDKIEVHLFTNKDQEIIIELEK